MMELWKEIRGKRAWRAGHRFAGEIIKDWTSGSWSDEEIYDRLARSRLAREVEFSSPYRAGYCVGWQEFGTKNASDGVVQARKFKSHWYNMGWWNQMTRMRSHGWRHPRLDAEYDRMSRLYWDQIKLGQSDDYYKDHNPNLVECEVCGQIMDRRDELDVAYHSQEDHISLPS